VEGKGEWQSAVRTQVRCERGGGVGGNGVMNWARDRAVSWVLTVLVFVSVRSGGVMALPLPS
jgi:hypothetical protein